MDWSKRLKSFGMNAGALIGTAIVAALVSPDFQALIVGLGWSAPVVGAIALALGEGWKALVNSWKLAQADKVGAGRSGGPDLY